MLEKDLGMSTSKNLLFYSDVKNLVKGAVGGIIIIDASLWINYFHRNITWVSILNPNIKLLRLFNL